MEIYTKEKKLEAIQILKENHDTQRILVRKKKRALVSADLKRRMAVIQKKEDETMESQRTREKEKMGKAKLTQTRWFMIVVMASRVNRMRHLLEVNYQSLIHENQDKVNQYVALNVFLGSTQGKEHHVGLCSCRSCNPKSMEKVYKVNLGTANQGIT